jgi:hypothetical protein
MDTDIVLDRCLKVEYRNLQKKLRFETTRMAESRLLPSIFVANLHIFYTYLIIMQTSVQTSYENEVYLALQLNELRNSIRRRKNENYDGLM